MTSPLAPKVCSGFCNERFGYLGMSGLIDVIYVVPGSSRTKRESSLPASFLFSAFRVVRKNRGAWMRRRFQTAEIGNKLQWAVGRTLSLPPR
jgi:hypothetical protein